MSPRPVYVQVLALINFCYSLLLCIVWCGSCQTHTQPGAHSDISWITFNIPGYRSYATTQAFLGVFAGWGLIAGSKRVLYGERGGRLLCLVYSIYAIASQLLGLYVSVRFVQPVIGQSMLRDSLRRDPLSAIIWVVIMSHAIVLLAAMINYDEPAQVAAKEVPSNPP